MKKVLCIMLLFLPFGVMSQNDSLADKKTKGWCDGFIIKREKGDTLSGKIKKRNLISADVVCLEFKGSSADKAKAYPSDSIKGFNSCDILYWNFNSTGWTKAILTGRVNLFEGMLTTYLGNGSPCYVLKKGNEPALFVEKISSAFTEAKISKKKKEELTTFFSDRKDLVERIKTETFFYKDIINLVLDYNNN